MEEENYLKEKFKTLKENNEHKDWNDSTFRDTIIDAFRFCCNRYIEEKQINKQKAKRIIYKYESLLCSCKLVITKVTSKEPHKEECNFYKIKEELRIT